MTRRLLAIALALGFLVAAAVPGLAVQDSEKVVQLPFSEAECAALVERGAPFQVGNPDPREGDCFIIVDYRPGRVVLPFDRGECQILIGRGAPFQIGNGDEVCIIIIGGQPPPNPDQPPERG
jgi:hypothetical protein